MGWDASLCEDVQSRMLEVETIAYGVPVHPVSTARGDGVEAVRSFVPSGRTAALVGSSGVGKSTLVNALAGGQVLATKEVREDGRGRHTTTHRRLVPLPDGGLVLDTPGKRELQLWEAKARLDTAFDEIGALGPAAASPTARTAPSQAARFARHLPTAHSTSTGSRAGASCSASSSGLRRSRMHARGRTRARSTRGSLGRCARRRTSAPVGPGFVAGNLA